MNTLLEIRNIGFEKFLKIILQNIKQLQKLPLTKFEETFGFLGPNNTKDKWWNILRLISRLGDDFLNKEREVERAEQIWEQSTVSERTEVLNQILDLNDNTTPPEAPKDAILGQYMFADQRTDVPKEKNTKIEQSLYAAIRDQLNRNNSMPVEDVKIIYRLLKSGQYKSMIKAPEQSYVYRGMSVDEEYLRSALKLNKEQEIESQGVIKSSFTFTPKNASTATTSWTKSLDIAKSYALSKKNKKYELIMIASVNENAGQFIDCAPFYAIKEISKYRFENEVIGIGSIKVSKIIWNTIKE